MQAPSLPKHLDSALEPYRFEKQYADYQEHWVTTQTNALGFRKLVAVGLWYQHAPPTTSEWFQAQVPAIVPKLLELNHPGLAQLYEWGLHQGRPYRAYEYVPGVDLQRLMTLSRKRGRPLPRDLAIWIVQRLCEAFDYGHRAKASPSYHDLLPIRVMLGFQGEIKVMDYGDKRLQWERSVTDSGPGMRKQDLSYICPELIKGLSSDGRTSVFSLGALLYTLTTGRQPFLRENAIGTLRAIMEGEVCAPRRLDPTFCPALQRVIQKAMLRKPQARFQNAAEMAFTLSEYLKRTRASASTSRLRRYLQDVFPMEKLRAQRLLRPYLPQTGADSAPTVKLLGPRSTWGA